MEPEVHDVNYVGRLHVRAAERGVRLEDAAGASDVEEWVLQALKDAGVLQEDEWHSGRDTAPVGLTLLVDLLK